MSEEQLYEYQMLREEIMEKTKMQNNISTSTISLAVGVLTLVSGLDFQNLYLYLLPLLFLLPSALKTTELKGSISVISGYLSVRYESINGIYWETAYNRYRKMDHPRRSIIFVLLKDCEYAVVGVICVSFYLARVISDIMAVFHNSDVKVPAVEIFIGILAVFMVVYLFCITRDYGTMSANVIDLDRSKWDTILNRSKLSESIMQE